MAHIIPLIISTVLATVAIGLTIYVMNLAHMDLMPLWVGLTAACAVGCVFIFNFKREVVVDK